MFPDLNGDQSMLTQGLAEQQPQQGFPQGEPAAAQAAQAPEAALPQASMPLASPAGLGAALGQPTAPTPGPFYSALTQMADVTKQMEAQRQQAASRAQQREAFLQQLLTTDALGKYLPKPSASQMLSDALANFGMARLTKGNFTPIQVRRYDEAFKRHGADVNNAQLMLQNDKSEESAAGNAINQQLSMTRVLEKLQNDFGNLGVKQDNTALKAELAKAHQTALAGTIPGAALKTAMQHDSIGNPIDENAAYHASRDNAGKIIAAYPAHEGNAAKPAAEWFRDSDSSTGYSHAYIDPNGGAVRFVVRNAEPPSTMKDSITRSMKFVQQPDNTWKAVPVETTRSRGNTAAAPGIAVSKPGSAAPSPALPPATPTPPTSSTPFVQPGSRLSTPTPPVSPKSVSDAKTAIGLLYDDQGHLRIPTQYTGNGPVRAGQTVGGRGLPPQARMAAEGSAKAMDITSDRMATVLKNADKVGGLIDAGKIALAMRPDGLAAVSRLTSLTPEEEHMAAALTNLTEDVNIFRKPFNATGFRGPEAFAALQSQKGNLFSRPNIMKEVLVNGVKALQGQRAAIDKALAAGGQATPNAQVASNYAIIAASQLGAKASDKGLVAQTAKALAKADGYKVD